MCVLTQVDAGGSSGIGVRFDGAARRSELRCAGETIIALSTDLGRNTVSRRNFRDLDGGKGWFNGPEFISRGENKSHTERWKQDRRRSFGPIGCFPSDYEI
jgi:hypothetical protein